MPLLSTSYVAMMLICSGGEGCMAVPVKDPQRYTSKADCITALPALPQLRKSKYRCEPIVERSAPQVLPSPKQSETMVAH